MAIIPNNADETSLDIEKTSLLEEPSNDYVKVRRFSWRTHPCWYLAIALVSWMGLRLFVRTTTSLLFRGGEVDVEHYMPHRTKAQVKDIYVQYRDTKRMGLTDEYVDINTYQDKHRKRKENMRQLDMIRFGQCGGFEQALVAHQDNPDIRTMIGGTNWTGGMPTEHSHCDSGRLYKEHNCERYSSERFVCEAPHPVLQDVTVTIERIGPFTGTGGYDWEVVSFVRNLGVLRDRMSGRNWTFVGGMVAPVNGNGTILGYPPIHIHHAHVFPIGDDDERGEKIRGSVRDHHDLFFQGHGDSECFEEEGGVACLLHQLDEGYGFVVDNSTSGLSANFELNDVRPKDSPPMEYWFEIALLHTPRLPAKRTTYIGLNSPCIGTGPCTYMYPMDPHNNAMWYQYIHGQESTELANGTMSDFVLHSHQTIFDSAFLIKAPNDDLFNALESYRGRQPLPMILDCHNGGTDLEVAKKDLLSLIRRQGASLICEATKPGLVFVEDDNGNLHARDKRAKLNCLKEPVDLNFGDRLVVIAFNTVHESKYTRKSKAFREQNVFSDFYAVYQHTIFRFNLNYKEEVPYAPPSYFAYTPLTSLFKRVTFSPNSITASCPASIQYRMQSEWRSWLGWFLGF